MSCVQGVKAGRKNQDEWEFRDVDKAGHENDNNCKFIDVLSIWLLPVK